MAAPKGNQNGKKFGTDYQPENRRKPDTLTDVLKQLLFANDSSDLEAIAGVLISEAKAGNIRAIQLIFDRLEGKAVETINTTSTNTLPVVYILPADNSKPPVTDEADVNTDIE